MTSVLLWPSHAWLAFTTVLKEKMNGNTENLPTYTALLSKTVCEKTCIVRGKNPFRKSEGGIMFALSFTIS